MQASLIKTVERAQGGGGYPPGGYGPPGGDYPAGGGYPLGGDGLPGGGNPPGAGGPPYGGFVPPAYGGPPLAPNRVPTVDPIEAVAFGWNAVTKNFSTVAAPITFAMLLAVLPAMVLGSARGFMLAMLGTRLDTALRMAINIGGYGLTQLVSIPVQAYMFGGINHFALRVCRGEKPDLNVVFSGGQFFLPMLGAQLLFSLGAGLGFVLCVVPGIALTCGWLFYQQFVVDKGLGPIDALTASWRATAGQRMNVFVYLLLSFAVVVAGLVALCAGALVISVPVLTISNVYLYLKLTGQQPQLAV